MYETWTSKNSKISLNGYSKVFHSFRRFQNRRAKRASGGIIIYTRDGIKNGVKLVKNDNDSIVWFKLEKSYFCTKNDRYIVAAYIPPENSPLHDIYDINLFQKIETEVSYFSQFGETYLIGDLNSRVGKKCDFIDHDSTLPDMDDDMFSPDAPLRRLSIDCVSNRFGDYLLDLCKATEMRIVNGRIFEHTDKMTCFTHNGESVVDYLITCENNFSSLSSMTVHEYNEFLNHAPISFAFKVGTERSREANAKFISNIRWNEEHKGDFVNSLKNDIHILLDIVQQEVDVNTVVETFSKFVTDRANVFFKKTYTVKNETMFTNSNNAEMKRWYNEICMQKMQTVQEAI